MGVPVEVSVKVVLTGTVPDTGVAVNEATGAAGVLVVVWQVPDPVSVRQSGGLNHTRSVGDRAGQCCHSDVQRGREPAPRV